jgi:hypothetical protein
MSTKSQMHTSNPVLPPHAMWRYAQAQRSRAGDLLTTRQSMTSQQLLGSQYDVSPLETGPGALARGPAAAAAAAQLPERPEDLYNNTARSGSVKAAPTKTAPRRHGSLAFHVPVIYLLGPVCGPYTQQNCQTWLRSRLKQAWHPGTFALNPAELRCVGWSVLTLSCATLQQ